MSVVEDYLNTQPDDVRIVLQHVRDSVIEACPSATEVITYGMPGYKYKNKYLIAFLKFKDHYSIFPGAGAIERFASELEAYKISKGTIQFTEHSPLSNSLINKIIVSRMQDIDKTS